MISGFVYDSKNQHLPYVSVFIMNNDSVITGSVSDTTGFFKLSNIDCSNCQVCASFLGYKDTCFYQIAGQTNVKIVLQEDNFLLDQVVIEEKRPLIKNEENKTIINIQNTILTNSESSKDLLKYLPGIIKTQSGYTVFGKGTPLILINGKEMKSEAELENIRPENIIKIEMFENSGKYDASIQYIINYVTKTLKDFAGGQVYNRITFNPKINNDLRLYFIFNNKKINQSFFYNNYTGYSPWIENAEIINFSENGNDTLNFQNFQSEATDYSADNSIYYGLDYTFDSTQIIGLQLNYDNSSSNNLQTYTSNINNLYYLNKNTENGKKNSLQTSINYNLRFLKTMSFSLISDYYTNNNDKTRTLNQNNLIDKLTNNNNYKIFSIKTDLLIPLTTFKSVIEFGAKASDVKNENNTLQKYNTISGLEKFNNSNILTERTYAIYLRFKEKISEQINFLFGTRYENYRREISDITNNNNNQWLKNNFFPSISLQYQLSKAISISTMFNKIIDRSSYSYLANQDAYINPYLYKESNMYLVPDIIDNFSISSTLFNTFNIQFEFVKHNNYTTMFFGRTDSITTITYNNTKKTEVNLIFGSSLQINESFTSLNINFNKSYFTYMVFNNEVTPKIINYSIVFNNVTPIIKGYNFDISIEYNSKRQIDLFYYKPEWFLEVGVKKNFTKNLRIAIYYSYRSLSKYEMRYNCIKINDDYARTPNTIFISFLYKLHFSKKWNENKSSFDEEINRINN